MDVVDRPKHLHIIINSQEGHVPTNPSDLMISQTKQGVGLSPGFADLILGDCFLVI